jgi:hypothetical protein
MFLYKKNKLRKLRFFFLKKKYNLSDSFFLGKSHLSSHCLTKKKNIQSCFLNPIGFFKTRITGLFSTQNSGIFSFFKNNNNFLMVLFSKPFSVFNLLKTFVSLKSVYSSCNGTFVIFKSIDIKKKILNFVLPSGSVLHTSLYVIGVFGKNQYKFKKYKFDLLYKNGKKSIRVSGVSMNPVDHHNGGRSNRKPLFLNKYNRVAKAGKKC